ncbi:DUF885 domain-containing protein [Sphingomonas sp. GCM10030256]|uniref:DUF885 domain-containing protein n=1 Tax=Sphingomonas sp. GCM10030256 TaxID=3273427 RepID=UPI0036121708
MLQLEPEAATNLGLDVGARAGLKSQLTDLSVTGRNGWWAPLIDALPRLRAFDRARLPLRERALLDTAIWFGERAVQRRSLSYGINSAPYVITQIYGSYVGVPNFLDVQHKIETHADAQAYLDRLEAFPGLIDSEVALARADAAAGIVPPDFILDKALRQTRTALGERGSRSGLVSSLVGRAQEKNLPGDWEARAVRIVDGPLAAALGRQEALLTEQRRIATSNPGISRLPNGDEFYAYTLRVFNSTGMSAQEVHRLGLEEVARLTGEADPLLRARGIGDGAIGRRIASLEQLPGQLFANNDEGRRELLTYISGWMDRFRARMPEIFYSIPTSPMEVRRVPIAIEVGSAGAYAQATDIEGTRPGIFYINLQDVHSRPRFGLPTLTAHEAIPGHLWQGAIVNSARDLPMLHRATGISAFAEGWGLYAETLADELGFYRDEPLARIGMIQSFLFRAARLVVDTGIHAMGWSREHAIRYFMDTVGRNRGATEREIDRYVARPGQATAYKIGHNEMLRLRDEARRRLGARFDLKAYHDLMLLTGDIPLEVLASMTRAWNGERVA